MVNPRSELRVTEGGIEKALTKGFGCKQFYGNIINRSKSPLSGAGDGGIIVGSGGCTVVMAVVVHIVYMILSAYVKQTKDHLRKICLDGSVLVFK
jgi:hypothetical protein